MLRPKKPAGAKQQPQAQDPNLTFQASLSPGVQNRNRSHPRYLVGKGFNIGDWKLRGFVLLLDMWVLGWASRNIWINLERATTRVTLAENTGSASITSYYCLCCSTMIASKCSASCGCRNLYLPMTSSKKGRKPTPSEYCTKPLVGRTQLKSRALSTKNSRKCSFNVVSAF